MVRRDENVQLPLWELTDSRCAVPTRAGRLLRVSAMSWRAWLVVCALVAPAAADPADPVTRVTVGDGYTIAIESHAVMVHAGARSAWLAGNAEGLTDVHVDAKKKHVELWVDRGPGCMGTQLRFDFNQLGARIENTAAYVLHKKHDWKGAAAGYAKAIALDPAWR